MSFEVGSFEDILWLNCYWRFNSIMINRLFFFFDFVVMIFMNMEYIKVVEEI